MAEGFYALISDFKMPEFSSENTEESAIKINSFFQPYK